jgi:hypothetical protein
MTTSDPKIVITEEAREFIREDGGELYLWARRLPSCTVPQAGLEAGTHPPADERDFMQVAGNGIAAYLHLAGYPAPREIEVVLHGRRHRRLRASCHGTVYLT